MAESCVMDWSDRIFGKIILLSDKPSISPPKVCEKMHLI